MSNLSIQGTSLRGVSKSAYLQKLEKNSMTSTSKASGNALYSKNSSASTQNPIESILNQSKTSTQLKKQAESANSTYSGPANMRFGNTTTQTSGVSGSTAAQQKKLRYNYKKISSLIRSAKNSVSAKAAVSKAKREVTNLKRKRGSESYDQDELEIAISHAMSMERVAKKREKNLETEELAKRGIKSADAAVDPEALEESIDEYEKSQDERLDILDEQDFSEMSSEELEEFAANMEKLMKEESEDMLEFAEGELFDMAMDLIAYSDGLTEEDLKEMQQRHRNSENREMTKADMQYLKDYLEYLEGKSASSDAVLSSNSSGVTATISSVTESYTALAELVDMATPAPTLEAGV